LSLVLTADNVANIRGELIEQGLTAHQTHYRSYKAWRSICCVVT